MSKEYFYKQVELARTPEYGGSLYTTITHIPKHLATVGKFVELKDKDDNWNTWQVITVSSEDLSHEMVKNISKKYHAGWNNNI